MTDQEKKMQKIFRNAVSNVCWGEMGNEEPAKVKECAGGESHENKKASPKPSLKKDTCLLGAVAGDTIGAPYEFDCNNIKTTDFPLFNRASEWTDDSVMTVAVAEAVMAGFVSGRPTCDKSAGGKPAETQPAEGKSAGGKSGEKRPDPFLTEKAMISSMQKWGRVFPYAGYGDNFSHWLFTENPQPYNSWGNGSAMRVSAVGWAYDTLEDVETFAEISARVTHNHPEGIKGAKAVAAAIFLGRAGKSKEEILDYVERTYGYPISKMTCDKIRPTYHMDESCQNTVPQAFCAFREGNSFEEVARLAVSLGGDSDTLCCIACSMAEAVYGIPAEIRKKTVNRLNEKMLKALIRFQKFLAEK